MRGLKNKCYLVTGASSGIGLATATRLAEEGSRIVLVARDSERLQAACASLPGERHLSRSCDVTDEDALKALFKELRETVETIDGLAHCAGIHWLRPLKVTNNAALTEMLTSQIGGSIAVTKAYVFGKVAPATGAAIVWLSSAAALQGESGTAAYSAAKGGLISAGRSLAVELAPRHIRLNVISPGVVRTPQSEAFLSQLSDERRQAIENAHLIGISEPADVAAAATYLLSEDSRKITGANLVVDGGLTIH